MKKTFIQILLLLTIGLAISGCDPKPSSSLYLNHSDSVEYVGMSTCRSCHEDKYNSFMETGMGQSFHYATPAKSSANFELKEAIYDSFSNLYYYPFWHKDSLFFKEFRLKGQDTTHLLVRRIDYIIGSGQHTNSHLYEENGYLFQAPLTWYAQKGKWGLPPGFENGQNTRFSRKIDEECMSCHNGLPKFEKHSGNFFEDIPLGIDCERCHGPGSAHVAKIARGELTDTSKDIDYSIVNPKKLSWQRQMDLCQRCHLQGNAVLKEGKRFTDFKPGMKLADFYNVFLPKYEEENNFIMASHVERLNKSKCYIESNKEGSKTNLTCITCHDPHVSVKNTSKQVFNAKCKSCHNDGKDCEDKGVIEYYQSADCINCHMPSSGTKDIPHVQIHDHKISKFDLGKKENGALTGLKVVNNPNASEEEMLAGYISYFEKFEQNTLYMQKAKERLSIANEETKIHFHYNLSQFKEIVVIADEMDVSRVSKPWTLYRICEAYGKQNQWTIAEIWAKKLGEMAPKNLDFLNKQVEIKLRNKKLEESYALLKKLESLHANYESTLIHFAKFYIQKNNLGNAKRYLNNCIKSFPDSKEANRLLSLYF